MFYCPIGVELETNRPVEGEAILSIVSIALEFVISCVLMFANVSMFILYQRLTLNIRRRG
jgi:hypothetical protein